MNAPALADTTDVMNNDEHRFFHHRGNSASFLVGTLSLVAWSGQAVSDFTHRLVFRAASLWLHDLYV